MQDLIAASRRLLAGAMVLAAGTAQALGLGEPDVRSSLGEPLDVRIPVESIDDEAGLACLVAGTSPTAVAQPVAVLERIGSRAHVRVRTPQAVHEPALLLAVRSGCDVGRLELAEVAVLLAPRAAGSARASPAVPPTLAPPAFRPGAGFVLRLAAALPDPQRRPGTVLAPVALREGITLRPSASLARVPAVAVFATASPAPQRMQAAADLPAPASMPLPDPAAATRALWRERLPVDSTTLAALALALLAVLAVLRARIRRGADRHAPQALPAHAAVVSADAPAPPQAATPPQGDDDAPFEVALAPRPAMSSDAALATRLPENLIELRRRYIGERFPEVERGAIALDDPASVVKGARLFHEDGATSRAIELLEFAVEDNPAVVKPWLALFEILRLERRAPEYAELAARFRERHGEGGEWPKVRQFGRELDPSHPLYRTPSVDAMATIGPREAPSLAAGAGDFDPVAENWLDAPMDFENEVLARDLRASLMAAAGLAERDLEPDPMPALRQAEMLTVA